MMVVLKLPVRVVKAHFKVCEERRGVGSGVSSSNRSEVLSKVVL